MAGSNGSLTLEGLAEILRDHMDGTAAAFAEGRAQLAEGRAQDAQLRARIEELRGEIGAVGALFRELTQIVLRQVDQLEEHRRQMEEHRREIRQVYFRMEQQNSEIAELRRDTRRILDAMERRGGDGGGRDQQAA